jgi:hypothetical protein
MKTPLRRHFSLWLTGTGDIVQVKMQVGAPVTAANFRTDNDAGGTVNASDIAQVKASSRHTLP